MLALRHIGNGGSGAADGGRRRGSVHFTARPRKAPLPHWLAGRAGLVKVRGL